MIADKRIFYLGHAAQGTQALAQRLSQPEHQAAQENIIASLVSLINKYRSSSILSINFIIVHLADSVL